MPSPFEACCTQSDQPLYLQALVVNGLGKRIMFGSDFPDQIEMGIEAIVTAEFLTPEQKSHKLCDNAARFLRLDAAICRP